MLFIPTSPGTKHCARPGPGAQCLSEEERWRKEKKAKKEQEPEPCRTTGFLRQTGVLNMEYYFLEYILWGYNRGGFVCSEGYAERAVRSLLVTVDEPQFNTCQGES